MIAFLWSMLRRLRFYLFRSRFEDRVAEELAFHREAAARDGEAAGLSPQAAAVAARRQLGRDVELREETREVFGFRQLEILRQDLRFAWRSLRPRPGFVALTVGIVGIGVGAVTAVVSVANVVLFRPMPVRDPSTLAWVVGSQEQGRKRQLAYPEIHALATDTATFAATIAYQDLGVSLSGGGREPIRASALMVTGNFFGALGIPVVAGRTLGAADDRAGAAPVVVLSHQLWTHRYGGDRGIVGAAVTISGTRFEVAGIAEPGYAGLEIESSPDLFVPMALQPLLMPANPHMLEQAGSWWLRAAVRLAPGVSHSEADATARVIQARVREANPKDLAGTGLTLARVRGGIDPPDRGEALSIFSLFLLAPVMVLAIGCANVANLLLARAVQRQREIGVRVALGASRGRIVRQLLTESTALAVAGGLLGVTLAAVFTPMMLRVAAVPSEVADAVRLDVGVLVAALAVTLLSGLGFGLAPALGSARLDVVTRLGVAGRAGRSRLMRSLAVAQVAGTLVMLVTCGLFLRTLQESIAVDPGFEVDQVATMAFDVTLQGYSKDQRQRFHRQLAEEAGRLPGVEAVSIAAFVPLGDRQAATQVIPVDEPGRAPIRSYYTVARPGLPGALGIPIVGGRDLTEQDGAGSNAVVLVNQTLAGRLWPGTTAIGRRLRHPWDSVATFEVVGVIGDSRYSSLMEPAEGYVVFAESQRDEQGEVVLVARVAGAAVPMVPALVGVARRLEPDMPVFATGTLRAYLRNRMDQTRGMAKGLASFGVAALAFATLGLYGIIAFVVSQRTREIGIRMAIGAAPGQVVGAFTREGLRLALVGVVVGLAVAVVVAAGLRHFFFGLSVEDAGAFLIPAVALMLAGGAASYFPARRGARVAPASVLRVD